MKALIYSRVSTDAQKRDGTSLDTQERACIECARSKGWTIVECIRDTASGFTLDRPGVERVRNLVRQGLVDVVVAYAVDRLSRNQVQRLPACPATAGPGRSFKGRQDRSAAPNAHQ